MTHKVANKGMTHEAAILIADGGFRVTRFEPCGNDIIRVVYDRVGKAKRPVLKTRKRKAVQS